MALPHTGPWQTIPDELIDACAKTGGVISINGVGIFLGDNDISTATVVRHIDYIVQRVGAQHAGIGLDFVFNQQSLDEAFNGKATQELQEHYVHNCNQCWLNFHRKYDVILFRTFEKYFGKSMTSKLFGYYQWEEDARTTYKQYFDKIGGA